MSRILLAPWERLLKLVFLERKDILQILYYSVFYGIVNLSLPLGIQAIINLIQGARISTSWIVLVILVTVGVIFASILQFMQIRIIETLQQRIFTRSSFELSYRFPKITMAELRNYYPPELANRFFDTLTIQKGFSKVLIDIPAALIQIFLAIVILTFYHVFFIIFNVILLFLVILVFQYTARKGLQESLIESKNKYKVVHWIQEVARSVISFKISGYTNLALAKNDALTMDYLKARERHFSIIKIQFIKLMGFKVIVTAGLLIMGGILVLNQQMNIGQFVAAEIIILLVLNSIEKLILGLETIYDILTSIEKLGQVVDKDLEAEDGEKPDFSKGMHIQLKHIYYSVKNKKAPLITDISLDIHTQSRMLIYGESGSGKSLLLRLISGLLMPTEGNIYVNHSSIKNIYLNHYRAHLGLSLSEEMPFEGTLRENLTFGDTTVKDERIYEVLENIGLAEFLQAQPQGLNLLLYPEGKRIPYTISKKIILARAILKDPKILILEDALDQFNKEETNQIIKYIIAPSHPWGVVVVGSNTLWRDYCREVIHLEDGKIMTEKH